MYLSLNIRDMYLCLNWEDQTKRTKPLVPKILFIGLKVINLELEDSQDFNLHELAAVLLLHSHVELPGGPFPVIQPNNSTAALLLKLHRSCRHGGMLATVELVCSRSTNLVVACPSGSPPCRPG